MLLHRVCFQIILYTTTFLTAQTLGPPKLIPKSQGTSSSSMNNVFFNHNHFNNNSFNHHNFNNKFLTNYNTTWHGVITNINQNLRYEIEYDSNFLGLDQFYPSQNRQNTFLESNDEFAGSGIYCRNDEPSADEALLYSGESKSIGVWLKYQSSGDSTVKKRRTSYGIQNGLGIFRLSKSDATGGFLGFSISLWHDLNSRIKLRERLEINHARSWMLDNDISRQVFIGDSLVGYQYDISDKYAFNSIMASIEVPIGLIYSRNCLRFLYIGTGVWCVKQDFSSTRFYTYNADTSYVTLQSQVQMFRPLFSAGALVLQNVYTNKPFRAIIIDLGYRAIINKNTMNSNLFMDIDKVTSLFMLSIGILL